ncbi:MAG: hypothetical protein GY756_05270 [bacterium]|nr:hypothetical protein [bacterium]
MALFSDRCEKCGLSVKKRARFCSKCGEPAPGSWIRCHKCSKWIGTESEFCPHCKAAQHTEERESVANGVLNRNYGNFLQRIDLETVSSRLGKEKKIVIEHGNSAIFMEEGRISDVLQPGAYKLEEGIFKRFIFGKNNMTLFLIDSGEIAFPYSQKNMRSKDDMKLSLYTEVILKFNPQFAGNIIANVLKSERNLTHTSNFDAASENLNQKVQDAVTEAPLNTNLSNRMIQLGYSDFWDFFKTDIFNAVNIICSDTGIDDLIRNPDIRYSFENTISEAIETAGSSYGMSLVRIAAVQFFGGKYEELRTFSGEVEVETRKKTLERRAREMLLKEKKLKLSNEDELNRYINQLAYEYDVDTETQQNSLDALRMDLSHKLNLKGMSHDHELKSSESAFDRSENSKDVDHKIIQDRKQHGFDREKRKGNHQDEIAETTDWIKIRALRDAQKLDSEKERMAVYSKYSATELAAVLPPEQIDKIIKIRQIEAAAKLEEKLTDLTPEQILAMKSEGLKANSKTSLGKQKKKK